MEAKTMIKYEHAEQFAHKYKAENGDIKNVTDEALEKAFKGCVLPPKPYHNDAVREAIKRIYG